VSFLSFVCALSRIRSFCVQSCPIIVDVTVPNCNRWKTCFGIHLQKLSKMIMNYQKLSETKYHGLVVFNCYRNKGYCSQKIDCLEAWRTLNLHQVARMLGLPPCWRIFCSDTESRQSRPISGHCDRSECYRKLVKCFEILSENKWEMVSEGRSHFTPKLPMLLSTYLSKYSQA